MEFCVKLFIVIAKSDINLKQNLKLVKLYNDLNYDLLVYFKINTIHYILFST
jgi:hypothetical protein